MNSDERYEQVCKPKQQEQDKKLDGILANQTGINKSINEVYKYISNHLHTLLARTLIAILSVGGTIIVGLLIYFLTRG